MDWRKLKFSPLPEQRTLQNRILNRFIREQVFPFSPYYRALFKKHRIAPDDIRTLDDLKRIPFTSKPDLVPDNDNPKKTLEFLLAPTPERIKTCLPWQRQLPLILKKIVNEPKLINALRDEYQPILLTATTGRSHHPVPFLYSAYDTRRLEIAGTRLIDVFGVNPADERGVNIFPFAPHLAFWQVAFAGFASRMLILGTGGGKVMGTKGNLAAIEQIKPSFIVGVPGYIYHLLRAGMAEHADFSSITKVVLGAEKVPRGMKEKIIELLRSAGAGTVSVLGTYGFTEARMAFAECPSSDPNISHGYHLYPDMGIFEVINPETGENLLPGETGELVYTPLDARGTVVIRYRTGDIASNGILTDPCPGCGARVPRISASLSRVSNMKDLNLSKVKGTLLNLNLFEELLYNHKNVEEWQVEIAKKNNDPFENDELNVYISPRSGADTAELARQLNEEILSLTEIIPNRIEFLPLKEMLRRLGMETELKEKRIIDTRP